MSPFGHPLGVGTTGRPVGILKGMLATSNVISARATRVAALAMLPVHNHPEHQLLVPTRGVIDIDVAGQTLTLRAPQMVLIAAGQPHAYRQRSRVAAVLAVYVPTPLLTAAVDEAGAMVLQRHTLAIRELAYVLIELSARRDASGAETLSRSMAWLIAAAMAPTVDEGQRPPSPYVARALAFMRAHLREPVVVSTLARLVGTSERNLRRDFHRELSRSPRQIGLELRLDYAAEHLQSTDVAIEAVAAELGFASTSHFVQAFRRRHGETPARLRQRRRPPAPAAVSSKSALPDHALDSSSAKRSATTNSSPPADQQTNVDERSRPP